MERKKGVTLEHIAAEVGVSIVTVSNALKGKKGVSEEMRRRIREAAERLGYRTAVKTGNKSYKIGVAVAERHVKEFPSFYMEIYQSAAQELTIRGSMAFLKVLSGGHPEKPGESAFFPGVDIDGILLIGEMDEGYAAELKASYQVPVVCAGSYDISEGIDYIVPDCYGGMEQVTELLLEAGHRNLVFAGAPKEGANAADCYLGFCKAMEKRGLEGKSEKLLHHFRMQDNRITADAELPRILPDAFVCDSAASAGILMEKLQEQGIRVPEDVSVAGFGRFFAAPRSEWKLTTYENDERVIAHLSVTALIERVEGRKKAGGVRIVEGRVVQGNTVRKAAQDDRTGKAGRRAWEV